MPQIQRSSVSGCCVGAYYYDLGGAHNKYRCKNLEEFAYRLIDIGMNQINIALTNSSQGPERAFLEQLGFTKCFKAGGMHLHAVDSKTLEKNLGPYRKIRQEKLEAERIAKEKIERERQAKLRAEEDKRKAVQAEKDKVALESIIPIASLEDVSIAWIREQYNRYPTVSVASLFNKLFNFTAMPDWVRKYEDEKILRSINSRLARRRADALAKTPASTPVEAEKRTRKAKAKA